MSASEVRSAAVPVALILFLGLFVSCGGDGDTVGPGSQRLRTSISIPALLDIPDGGTVAATFTAFSEGPVSSETWFVRPVTYADEVPWQELGTGGQLEHTFVEMGTYEVRVVVRSQVDGGIGAIAVDTTVVFPSAVREYEERIAFVNWVDEGSGESAASIFLLNLATLQTTVALPAPPWPITGNALSWGPARQRLALAKAVDGGLSNIHVLDLASGSLTQIEYSQGISWVPAWNPTKDWIAYVDDTRIPGRISDELTLIRPDGSARIFPSGATQNELFWGLNLAWSPDGERLAFTGRETAGVSSNRILLFSFDDLLAGVPRWDRLNTEEQLQSALGALYDGFREGVGGIAWSPDGTLIAHGAQVRGEIMLVISRADGSGEVSVLPYADLPGAPTWSPDGRFLVFSKHVGPFTEFHLFLVDAQGKNPIDLSRLRLPGQNPDDNSPAW